MLTKQQIKDCKDIRIEKVPVPEWGDEQTPVEQRFIFVRGRSAAEKDQFENQMIDQKRKGKGPKLSLANIRARTAAMCVVDQDGNQLFDESDIAWLGKKSVAPIDRIWAAVAKLEGTTEEELEELEKNLESIPTEDSSSD